jgi:hypothetical protein
MAEDLSGRNRAETQSQRENLRRRKGLIILILWSWLAALDDFRNWLIREAA